MPILVLGWMTSERIGVKLEHAHPTGSALHQKIVMIDDALAFCGGIDMTADRWDTLEHLDEAARRVRLDTKRRYGPRHDAKTAIDGDAARALEELVRDRWKQATGEDIPLSPAVSGAWPEGLDPSMTDVGLAIARQFRITAVEHPSARSRRPASR